jgi:3-phenylpropionate/trans-cinnamate dioxygenase ferredoxin reductase subunit
VSDEGIVVVGGGPAAQQCIAAYRDAGGAAPVLLVSGDDRLPYARPALTKEYLRGEVGPEALPLVEASWYGENDVRVRLGVEATGLDPPQRTIRLGTEVVTYSACVLATGSSAAPLPVPGGDDPRLLTIRHASDAERVMATVDALPGPVTVIGSGFIGCEAAASLRGRGCDVTMVSMEEVPQVGRLGHDVGEVLAGWLREAGVRTRFDRDVEAVVPVEDGWRVVLVDGEVEAAHVLAATGAKPNVELAERAGLVLEGGVVVDPSMRTTTSGVLAAGDIAAAWHPAAGRRLRVEHWGDAVAMGAVAGHCLAGQDDEWSDVPGFWSTIGERTLKHAAWGDGWDEVRLDGDGRGFTAWYGRRGVTVGVLTHERDEDYERGQRLVVQGAPLPGDGSPAS